MPNQISCCLDCVHPIDELGQCLIAKMFEKPVNPEHGCSWRVPIKRKAVLTNADLIRQMTDEELAKFLNSIASHCREESCGDDCPLAECCACDWDWQEKWLKQEAKPNG